MLITQGTKRHFLPTRRLHNTGAGKKCHGHRHVLLLYRGATGLSRLLHDITEETNCTAMASLFEQTAIKNTVLGKREKGTTANIFKRYMSIIEPGWNLVPGTPGIWIYTGPNLPAYID